LLVENGVATVLSYLLGSHHAGFCSLSDGGRTRPRYVFYANQAVDRNLARVTCQRNTGRAGAIFG
jgi:hypothetical protein